MSVGIYAKEQWITVNHVDVDIMNGTMQFTIPDDYPTSDYWIGVTMKDSQDFIGWAPYSSDGEGNPNTYRPVTYKLEIKTALPLDSRCVFAIGCQPSTLGAGSQRSEPKHVPNLASVLKKFNPHFIYDCCDPGRR